MDVIFLLYSRFHGNTSAEKAQLYFVIRAIQHTIFDMIKVFQVVEIFRFSLNHDIKNSEKLEPAIQLQFSTPEETTWGVIFSDTIAGDGAFPENPVLHFMPWRLIWSA